MADENSGFLNIPDSLGRDIDAGRMADKDIVDFLPDSVAQQLYDDTVASHAPVHGENLIPISKAEAARRTTFDGESMPQFPSTRRVIPPPFQRQRVMGGKHGKTWAPVPAREIDVGDIITDVGLVTYVERTIRYSEVGEFAPEGSGLFAAADPVAEGTDVVVQGAGGLKKIWDADAEVMVFRLHGA